MSMESENPPLESTTVAFENTEKNLKMSFRLNSSCTPSSSLNKDERNSTLQLKDDDLRYESIGAPHNTDIQEVSLKKLMKELQQAVTTERKKFHEAVNLPVSEKAKKMRIFSLELCRDENKQVAKIFVLFSVAMFTVPLVVLPAAIKLCEISDFKSSSNLIGSLASIGSVIIIMAAYVLYSFYEDQYFFRTDEGVPAGENSEKKRQRQIFSKEKKD